MSILGGVERENEASWIKRYHQKWRGSRFKTQNFKEGYFLKFALYWYWFKLIWFREQSLILDVLFLKSLGKVVITKQQSFLLKLIFFFFLHSHCLCAFVLIWLSSCQPPYGNLPTLTISIFVVLTGATILREGVGVRAGEEHHWSVNRYGLCGVVQTACRRAVQNRYL